MDDVEVAKESESDRERSDNARIMAAEKALQRQQIYVQKNRARPYTTHQSYSAPPTYPWNTAHNKRNNVDSRYEDRRQRAILQDWLS